MKKHNKLLVQGDYPIIASPSLAQAYGIPSAIFLQKLHYCLQNSEVKVIHKQKYFYHSYEQWTETLGVYSISTIKRVVSKLKKAGILIIKKLAQNKWEQTNFYSINYQRLRQELNTSQVDVLTKAAPIEAPLSDSIQSEELVSPSMKPQPRIDSCKVNQSNIPSHTEPLSVGLSYPLQPMATTPILEQMTTQKRRLYHQLLQLKVDIHYDDARLDEWLSQSTFIVRKVVYQKDQLGHLKYLWHSPEQLELSNL